jgi:hypothetical protein
MSLSIWACVAQSVRQEVQALALFDRAHARAPDRSAAFKQSNRRMAAQS